MKFVFVLCLAVFAFVSVQGQLSLAEPCDASACQLPDCRCSSTNIPGNLSPRDTPQFVLVTFDSAVSVSNIMTYRELLFGRNNINSCPIRATFFVSHQYTDYTLVNELYNRGFEIALNSMSRQYSQAYWRYASEETLMREFSDQRNQIAHFANIPVSAVQGIRSPMFQLSGNGTYEMMRKSNLKYDMSWPTMTFSNPGLWPYTLHYRSIQDCNTPYCPTASIPGPWVIPMINWFDLRGFACTVIDACYYSPDLSSEDAWFNFFVENFERHYMNNRAPFGFHIGQTFVSRNVNVYRAVIRFFNMLNNLHDVFMVSADEVVEWVKNPIPVNEYSKQPCPSRSNAVCRALPCNSLAATHTSERFYMQICNRCPRVYPWLNNPLGELASYHQLNHVTNQHVSYRAADVLPPISLVIWTVETRHNLSLVTFDNAIQVTNIGTYRNLLFGRNNKNACPIRASFFVSHEYTDYTLVNELYNRGYEIGLNSISRQVNQTYWRYADVEDLMSEFADQRNQIAHFANIPTSAVQGIRSPLLQLSGNATYEMMIRASFKYDMSWPTVAYVNPGLWPYTLHYRSTQDCITPYCPSASLPGPWVIPMITWFDLQGIPCTVIDSCFYSPALDNEDAWFNFFVENFERHYLGNRAPFGFNVGEGFVSSNAAVYRAVVRFFDMLNNLHDVFMVSADEVVEWVKNPVPINEYSRQQCASTNPAVCRAIACNSLEAAHTTMRYYMQICNRCPRVYPWLNNPLGELQN